MLPTALCALAGGAVFFGGWKLLKSQEVPPGSTSFVRLWSPRVLLTLLGYGLLFLGLMMCFVFAPMVWIAKTT